MINILLLVLLCIFRVYKFRHLFCVWFVDVESSSLFKPESERHRRYPFECYQFIMCEFGAFCWDRFQIHKWICLYCVRNTTLKYCVITFRIRTSVSITECWWQIKNVDSRYIPLWLSHVVQMNAVFIIYWCVFIDVYLTRLQIKRHLCHWNLKIKLG